MCHVRRDQTLCELGILRFSESNRCHIGWTGCWESNYFRTTVIFPANFVILFAVIWFDSETLFLGGRMYAPNYIKHYTPNISSILQWRFTERERKLHCSTEARYPKLYPLDTTTTWLDFVVCLGAAVCFFFVSFWICMFPEGMQSDHKTKFKESSCVIGRPSVCCGPHLEHCTGSDVVIPDDL